MEAKLRGDLGGNVGLPMCSPEGRMPCQANCPLETGLWEQVSLSDNQS